MDVIDQIRTCSASLCSQDFLRTLLGDNCRDVVLGHLPVTLFGAGAVGKQLCQVLKLHGVSVACFCDNNAALAGARPLGVPVVTVAEMLTKYKDNQLVISSCRYEDEIRRQLQESGYPSHRVCSVMSIRDPELLDYYQHCAYYQADDRAPLSPDFISHHREEIQAAFSLLADEKSRAIFVHRLALLLCGINYTRFADYIVRHSEWNERERESFPFYVSPEDYGYFNNDVLRLSDGEVLIDGGAYNGLSAATFLETGRRQGLTCLEVSCFEPEPKNFVALQKNLARWEEAHCYNLGLWSDAEELSFVGTGEGDPGAMLERCAARSHVAKADRIHIRTTSIDEMFAGKRVTLIKLDIEGAEREALLGAAQTIRNCRPQLAISAYHKPEDIFELLLLLHGMSPDYQFYLRQYGYTLFDMVLFATPAPSPSGYPTK